MKKTMVVIATVLFLAAFAMAQTYTLGSGITGVDKLGAHQNGGRGCTGCHAPHSGAFGAGGNAVSGQTVDKTNAVGLPKKFHADAARPASAHQFLASPRLD